MKRIGSTLFFAGIILIIGPIFGFTIHGTAQEFTYLQSVGVGIGSIIVGYFILKISNRY